MRPPPAIAYPDRGQFDAVPERALAKHDPVADYDVRLMRRGRTGGAGVDRRRFTARAECSGDGTRRSNLVSTSRHALVFAEVVWDTDHAAVPRSPRNGQDLPDHAAPAY
jgi:hypothetical protein